MYFRHVAIRICGHKAGMTLRVVSVHRAGFKGVSKVMLCLLWFCFTSLSDWIKKSAPLSQPIRS